MARTAAPFGADQGGSGARVAAPFGADQPSSGTNWDSLASGVADAGGGLLDSASSVLGGLGGMGGMGIPSLSGSGGQSSAGPSNAGDSADTLGGSIYAPMNVGTGSGASGGGNVMMWAALAGMAAWLIATR